MSQRIAIIDYGSGNLRSVEKALDRAAREAGVPALISVTHKPEEICKADRLLLPGVGAFGACMAGLALRDGVLEAMEHVTLVEERPFLGICVGMQLLAEAGFEFGTHRGLGWIQGAVKPILLEDQSLRLPHMGWNRVEVSAPHRLLEGLNDEYFYFAHSYHFETENDAHCVASSVHGERFSAAVARDNIAGVQFHPEKSQHAGITLLKNFLEWNPA